MKVYLASRFGNDEHHALVRVMREWGHEVFDYRDQRDANGDAYPGWPAARNWSECSGKQLVSALAEPAARALFYRDMQALHWCDAVVLLTPAGASAHLELGWAIGAGKKTAVLMRGGWEPELMLLAAESVFTRLPELEMWLYGHDLGPVRGAAPDGSRQALAGGAAN